jgi:outer membrane biosynthesis protein TonB
MKEEVGDVIASRAHDPSGLSRMMTWSFAVHVAVIATAILIPRHWILADQPKVQTMVISLGGAVGPNTTGMTPAPARPVEQVAPEPKRPEPIKPAAAKPDVMTVPVKPVKPQPPKPETTPKPVSPIAQPPTTGPQVRPGTSRAETGATTQGTGLTLGGGGTGGQIVASDFCCQWYITEMLEAIRRNGWQEQQARRGRVVVKFVIQRDGRVTDTVIEQGGDFLLEQVSKRPLFGLQLKPLPGEYSEPSLTIHLTFIYP